MKDYLHIFRKLTPEGVELKIGKKKYKVSYPTRIWQQFPKSLHKIFADNLAYLSTWHLPLVKNVHIAYHFPHPVIEPIFFKILLYSLTPSVFEFDNIVSSKLIKKFYNYNFKTQFKSLNYIYFGKKIKKNLRERAILLFSFGKDSLLTYGLLNELGVTPIPFFIREPQTVYENAHKRELAKKFLKKTNTKVTFFKLSTGRLRQYKDFFWGWDIILSQYIYTLLPFCFSHQTKYLLLGNEQSCNFYTRDDEGYFVNPVFEQSVDGMQLLQDIPKVFFINTHVGSLVEPVHELFITYILHNRYPEIAKFQMSCFADNPESAKRRWCGNCEKCARLFIFFKALNINPEKVGFYNRQMLNRKKKHLYVIFNHSAKDSAYGGSGLGYDEQLLAFYLAYKNGVKGDLINDFVKTFLNEAKKRKAKLLKEYFGIHTSYTLPSGLRQKTLRIFLEENKSFQEKFSKYL